jgi:hypothetical protein
LSGKCGADHYEITPVTVDGRSIAVIAVGRRRQGFAQPVTARSSSAATS